MMNETVAQIMATNLITVAPDDNLEHVRELLLNHHIQHIPVVEGKRLVGMISSYDLVKIGADLKDYSNTKVVDVMTTRLAKIEPTDKIGTAAEIFMEHLFHAVPVVNDGELVGLVTTFDILKYEYNKEYPTNN